MRPAKAGRGRPPASGSPQGLTNDTVSDARLASVLGTAVDGIIIIDEQARMMMFNRACERMFGYEAAEVIGQNVKMLMPREHSEVHDQYLDNYKRTGHRKIIGIGREVRGLRKDGTEFPLDLSVGEALTPDGRQFIGILRDLTTRKEAERRMNDLQADLIRLARVSALDEMGSALAHELNQPLTAVILYLQAVERELRRARDKGHSDEADARRFSILKKAQTEAQRAGAIIQRIRSLVEKRAPERRSLDLSSTVADVIDLTVIGQDRTVHLVRDLQPDLPPVLVDPVQIQQVVVNLVRNAYEAVRAVSRPRIIISTSLDDRHVLLSVEDNGPGIPEDKLANLFQAFKDGGERGMGIGLAISRTIAQSHGGELLVDPGGNGRGARFVVRLPLTQSEPERDVDHPAGVVAGSR